MLQTAIAKKNFHISMCASYSLITSVAKEGDKCWHLAVVKMLADEQGVYLSLTF